MSWQLLNKIVLCLVLFTLVNIEQFCAKEQPFQIRKSILRPRKLTARTDCPTPSRLTVIFTQDDYMLLYDPKRGQCSELVVYSWVDNRFQKRECELAPGSHWFYFRHFTPGEDNIFKIFDARTEKELLPETTRFFLPKKPPPVEQAWPKTGFGEVWTQVARPAEDGPNLLGYRISLLDLEKFQNWRVVGEFENVKYECSFPELAPVQNCPQWHKEGVYCTLFSDLVWWTNSYVPTSNDTMKFVKIETFRIPNKGCDKKYSEPLILPLYNLTNITAPEDLETTPFPLLQLNYTDWLWAIFLGLALLLLAVGIPLLYMLALWAGYGSAQKLWTSIASAPGNVTIGLGENQIVWENCPPWRCDT